MCKGFVCLFVYAYYSNLIVVSAFGRSSVKVQPHLITLYTNICQTNQVSSSSSSLYANIAGVDLLYQDQQNAMEARAEYEKTLLTNPRELIAPTLKSAKKAKSRSSGMGFSGGGTSSTKTKKDFVSTKIAKEQAKILDRDGVLRIDNVMSPDLADNLRTFILNEQAIADAKTQQDLSLSRSFYGVENQRKNRCDLQLSLLRGGFDEDDENSTNSSSDSHHYVADALQELLGARGTLRALYEHLVTLDGEFYELAALVTNPGSSRQMFHPDLPLKKYPPLYVIFVALQDVTEEMGPTTFLLGTHTEEGNNRFNDKSTKDELIANADCRLATLKKGDAILFDARVIHCGSANNAATGSTRAILNFSFRNPVIRGDLGYAGSIRPGYVGAMKLSDLSDRLLEYEDGNDDPFAVYGNGL